MLSKHRHALRQHECHRNRRNAAMPVMVLVLAGANGLYWWGALGGEPLAMLRGQRAALDVIARIRG